MQVVLCLLTFISCSRVLFQVPLKGRGFVICLLFPQTHDLPFHKLNFLTFLAPYALFSLTTSICFVYTQSASVPLFVLLMHVLLLIIRTFLNLILNCCLLLWHSWSYTLQPQSHSCINLCRDDFVVANSLLVLFSQPMIIWSWSSDFRTMNRSFKKMIWGHKLIFDLCHYQ